MRDQSGQYWLYIIQHLNDGDWLLVAVPRPAVPLFTILSDELMLPILGAAVAAPAPVIAPVSDALALPPEEVFIKAVVRAQEYIRAGDIFQIVPSQRFETAFPGDALDLYRALFDYSLKYGYDEAQGGFFDSGPFNAPADSRYYRLRRE